MNVGGKTWDETWQSKVSKFMFLKTLLCALKLGCMVQAYVKKYRENLKQF